MSEHIGQSEAALDPEVLATVQAKIAAYEQHVAFGEGYFQDTYGLAVDDLAKVVEYDDFKGPFIDALVPDDPERLHRIQQMPKEDRPPICPIGGKVAKAYKAGGHDQVQTLLNGYTMTAPEFSLTLSQASREIRPAAATVAIAGLKKKTLSH